jgi:hypothetical protein
MDEKQMKIIETAINGSELWIKLNELAKSAYEKFARVPSEEEYQTLRNVLICKVILEDKEVFNLVCEQVAVANGIN